MPKSAPFVPRTLPPPSPERPRSRAQRERDAKAYWDSLSEAQEVWALRKMGFFRIWSLTSFCCRKRVSKPSKNSTSPGLQQKHYRRPRQDLPGDPPPRT